MKLTNERFEFRRENWNGGEQEHVGHVIGILYFENIFEKIEH